MIPAVTEAEAFSCRSHCGACCIAPSINMPFFGMPEGKSAGVRCVHLSQEMRCEIFDDPRRPPACGQFSAEPEVCGADREQAMTNLKILEIASRPEPLTGSAV